MERGTERITLVTLIGWLVLAGLMAAIAAPIALWVGPSHHSLVVRLAGALFAASVFCRLGAAVRAAIEAGPSSPVELALDRPEPRALADPGLRRAAGDLRSSLGRGGSFHRVLRPRLLAIAESRGARLPPELLPRQGSRVRREDLALILAVLEEAE